MNTFLESIYINRIGPRLELFKQTSQTNYTCRCPICGDSKKNKTKNRFNFYIHQNQYFVKCYNCNYSTAFINFLKTYDFNLFNEFKLESLSGNKRYKTPKIEINLKTETKFNNILYNLKDVSKYPEALQYIISRQIPIEKYNQILLVDDPNTITNKIEKYSDKKYPNTPGYIFPVYSKDNNLTAFQLKYFDLSISPKYITFSIDEEAPRLFNENNIDKNKMVSITEGIFDSMFIDNSLASLGIGNKSKLDYLERNYSNFRIIVDNDYLYNKDVLNHLVNFIEKGYNVVIFDKNFRQKDINNSILSGEFNIKTINDYLNTRTFSGLSAKLNLVKEIKRK